MDVAAVATALREEAVAANERRSLVLAGGREDGYEVLGNVLEALSVPITATTLVGPADRLRCEHVPQTNADRLLGTTREAVILDAHRELRPNALGRVVGAVDGGGLLVLLTPPLDDWPDRRDAFDESLAVPPFDVGDVAGRFRRRLVEMLRVHRGIAVVDLEAGNVESDGLTEPAPRLESEPVEPPDDHRFPVEAYEACITRDQIDAVGALEALEGTGEPLAPTDRDAGEHPKTAPNRRAVVLEADRGRGKSSAAGIAAACLACGGADVIVTASDYPNASELFARAADLLEVLDADAAIDRPNPRELTTGAGGSVEFLEAAAVTDAGGGSGCTAGLAPVESADTVIVDEAAALPVSTLESLLAADRVAFATTVHGYEGAGRGFSVRFRDRLAESDHATTDVTLAEPIRYAAGDPVEAWAFRALLLDARPPVEPVVADATPETVRYRALEPADLVADERLLREAFGLLVLAHYRTEPADLARQLDAPNLEVRALVLEDERPDASAENGGTGPVGPDGAIGPDQVGGPSRAGVDHVVSVALLAREGGLGESWRARMYEGERIRGNMIPDVLTSQLRDEDAGQSTGVRIVRVATHHAVRSRGLGSRLLARIRAEFSDEVDWLGTGFGATPDLLRFWRKNGYGSVHVSTTRNDASGEHSALMLSPTSPTGRALHDRHARWFTRRFPTACSDALEPLDPDVIREVLRSVDATPPLSLSDHEWRVVAGAAYGPGLFDVDPAPFRRLAVRHLANPSTADEALSARQERLLVLRVLQGQDWTAVRDRLGYPSSSQCMRALGDALVPLVDRYGGEVADEVRERFREA